MYSQTRKHFVTTFLIYDKEKHFFTHKIGSQVLIIWEVQRSLKETGSIFIYYLVYFNNINKYL